MQRTRHIAAALVALAATACAPQPRGQFKLLSSRFVPSQYATVFYPRIQGRACLTGFFSRAENALQRALEDALRQRPEANGLALTEFWFDGRECFVVEGTPVRLK